MTKEIENQDKWTELHDLALVLMAFAYGTDRALSEDEINVLKSMLQEWNTRFDDGNTEETAIEALAVYLESESGEEIIRSVRSLKNTLSLEERKHLIEQLGGLARADGVLMSRERNFISVLSTEFGLKSGDQKIQDLFTRPGLRPNWTLMHDIGLVYLIVAHSTDNELSKAEIDTIIDRLNDWQPSLDRDMIQTILREVLDFYATSPGEEDLIRSVGAIRDTLPIVQRITLLDDAARIAESDGQFNDREREMIGILASALHVQVKLDSRVQS